MGRTGSRGSDDDSVAILNAARDACPTDCMFGFCLGEPYPYGEAGARIYWFPSVEALLLAMTEHVPAALLLTDDRAEVCKLSDAIRAALSDTPAGERLSESSGRRLQQALVGVGVLHWLGSLESLCTSEHDFAVQVREQFRDKERTDQFGRADRPIEATELQAFVRFLQSHGNWNVFSESD